MKHSSSSQPRSTPLQRTATSPMSVRPRSTTVSSISSRSKNVDKRSSDIFDFPVK